MEMGVIRDGSYRVTRRGIVWRIRVFREVAVRRDLFEVEYVRFERELVSECFRFLSFGRLYLLAAILTAAESRSKLVH